MTCAQIKELFSPLYGAYVCRRKVFRDAMDRLSRHSSAGYATVIAINAAAMLLKGTLALEFCYHFRPYYWKIVSLFPSLLYVSFLVVVRGTVWIFSVVWSILCVMWQLLVVICHTLMNFVIMLTSHLTSVFVYIVSFVLSNASRALSVAARVSRLLITPVPVMDLVKKNWKASLCRVILTLFVIVLTMFIWRRYKREKLDRVNSVTTERKLAKESTLKTVICPDSPVGRCAMGRDCSYEHFPMPYCWQFRVFDQWTSFSQGDNVGIEKLYCDVENLEVKVALDDSHLSASRSLNNSRYDATINFEEMSMQYGSVRVALRRLSTPSYIQEPDKELATKWTWYWKGDDGWKKYGGKKVSSKLTQENIEAAYLKGDQVYFFHIEKFNYMITFYEKSMYQKNMDPRYFTKRSVRRRPEFVAESELHSQTSFSPSFCNLMSSVAANAQAIRRRLKGHEGDFQRTSLSSDSKEFQSVKTQFYRKMSPRRVQISSVDKIKNEFLRERYERKRQQMKKKLKVSDCSTIEKQLFHGTSSEVIDAICKQNFHHRLYGKNGTMYGEGSYFAVEASYSNNYSSGENPRFMFLASVLTGEYKPGNSTLRRPPLKDPRNPASDLYDSCVDNEKDPQIFVIFNDEQCYPSYLITYNVRRV